MDSMKPGSISPIVRKAKYVIEANANTLSKQLILEDKIVLM